MSVNFYDRKRLKWTTNRKLYKTIRRGDDIPYWDEGCWSYHVSKGWRNKPKKTKQLLKWEYRKFRTWKHNRKTQWKQ